MAPADEGIGIKRPERDLAHADPDWYQRDLDEQIEDPDEADVTPLPTPRHRSLP